MKTSKHISFLFGIVLLSCTTNEIENTIVTNNSNAIPVYNQAYNENFDADSIDFIIQNAQNAYVLIDPFQENITQHIATIKANGNQIGAYISIGTGENWRADFTDIQPYLVSTAWGEWPNEFFINTVSTEVINLMKTRIDKVAGWGCDWIEFDNMDWIFDDELRATYAFEVTQNEGIAYYQELCNYAHLKGLKCMAKNTVEFASNFDGVLYESYNNDKNWWDVAGAKNFLNTNKLVIINHYNETNPSQVYDEYIDIYGDKIAFICEDRILQKYVHFNQ